MNLELQQLIADPIIALNKAEAENSIAYVDLLKEQMFDVVKDENTSAPLKMLSFSFERVNEVGDIEQHDISVPLLHFMPLSGLNVDQARLKYSLNIDHDQNADGAPRLRGRIAQAETERSGITGNIQVELDLRQMHLPKGVIDALEYTHGGVSRITPNPSPEPLPDPNVIDWPEQLFTTRILAMDPKLLEPGQTHKAEMMVTPHPSLIEQNIALTFSSGTSIPPGAIEETNFGFETRIITKATRIPVTFYAHRKIERYKEGTLISTQLLGEAKAPNGETRSLKSKIRLGRSRRRIDPTPLKSEPMNKPKPLA